MRAKDVMQWIADEMPEIIIGKPSFQFDQQGPGKGFSLQLSGDSTERLYELSFEVSRQLAAMPGLEGVHSEARSGDEQVHIVVDRDRAAQLGLTSETIAATVAAAMRGDRLRELRTAEREVDDAPAVPRVRSPGDRGSGLAADLPARRLDASASAPSRRSASSRATARSSASTGSPRSSSRAISPRARRSTRSRRASSRS